MPLLTAQKDRGDDEEPRLPDEPPEYAVKYLFRVPTDMRQDALRATRVAVFGGLGCNSVGAFILAGNADLNLNDIVWLYLVAILILSFLAIWEIWKMRRANSVFNFIPLGLALITLVAALTLIPVADLALAALYSLPGSLCLTLAGLALARLNSQKNGEETA